MNVVGVWDLVTCVFFYFRSCLEKSSCLMFKQYRWHHNADYDGARETDKILKKPSKKMKNTYSLFNLAIQIHHKQTTSNKTCLIHVKWNRNHPLVSLQFLLFNDITIFSYRSQDAIWKTTFVRLLQLIIYISEYFYFIKAMILWISNKVLSGS